MPAQNQFSGIGILDGQIVEAPHVSQSVDAFTALKDYDIILSGSLEVTGSINFSGSLVNEYTGEFKTLGIGTPAPTSPTMLHIKSDAAGGFDPIVKIEAKTGTDSARLRLQNPDVSYDLGAYGSADDDFRIVQDNAFGGLKTPFIIDKDTADYTLYVTGEGVGIGMGASSPSLIAALPDGSLQVNQLISSSILRSSVISASAAGENIHGTASYATFIETAQTASYVKSTNIDFYYSISQQVNSDGTVAVVTGSFNHLKLNDDSGAALRNVSNGSYTRFISGSTETGQGVLWLGNMDTGGTMIEINNAVDHIKLHAASTYMTGDAVVGDDLFISGSVTPSLVVGPAAAPGTINEPSSSLFANSLEFNRNNVAYIGNFNTSTTSKLQLSAGGGGSSSKMAIELSASKDTKLSGSLNIIAGVPSAHYDLKSYWNLGDTDQQLSANGRAAYYKMKATTTTSNSSFFAFSFGKYFSAPNANWTLGTTSPAGMNEFIAHFKVCALGTPNNANGVYLEREFLCNWDGSDWTILDTSTIVRKNTNSDYNTSIITGQVDNTLGNSFSIVIDPSTATNTDWAGWCETKRVGDWSGF